MSRETIAGEATVKLLCTTFGLSRQAYYAAKKGPVVVAKVVRLPVRPGVAPAALVLEKIRLIIDDNAAWGVRKVWATLRLLLPIVLPSSACLDCRRRFARRLVCNDGAPPARWSTSTAVGHQSRTYFA